MALSHPPRIVLMDFQLPGIDGLETTRRIRSAPSSAADTIIIGVTASAMAADRVACRNAGMDDFLAKPVSLEQLGEMLRRWTPLGPTGPSASHGADHRVLDTLAEELGDAGIVESLVATYLSELDSRRDDLQRAADLADVPQVRRKAHALKSSSMMLGLTDLGELCRRMELLANDTELPPLAAELPAIATKAEQDLRAWLERQRSVSR
jgi:CheY-like chemotaxis protein